MHVDINSEALLHRTLVLSVYSTKYRCIQVQVGLYRYMYRYR